MARELCKHRRTICRDCVVVTDAAKRISDAIGLAVVFHSPEEVSRGWMAFALADGQSDHVIYPSKDDAIRHQLHEFQCMYINVGRCLGGMPQLDAQIMLNVHREAYDAGMRLTDPGTIVMPQGREQRITRPTWQAERGYTRPWRPPQ